MRLPLFDISNPDRLRLPTGLTIYQLKNLAKKHAHKDDSSWHKKYLDTLSVRHFKKGWSQIFINAPVPDVRNFRDVRDAVCKIYDEWNCNQSDRWEIGYLGSIGLPLVPRIHLEFDMSGWQSAFESEFVYWYGTLEDALDSPRLEHIRFLLAGHFHANPVQAEHARNWDDSFPGLVFGCVKNELLTTIAPPPYAPSWAELARMSYSKMHDVPFEHVYARKK